MPLRHKNVKRLKRQQKSGSKKIHKSRGSKTRKLLLLLTALWNDKSEPLTLATRYVPLPQVHTTHQ